MKEKNIDDTPKSVAVVISTYNSPDFLRLCLHSLCRQTHMPDEVVIADDGSTAETCETITKFNDLLPIKHVWQEDKGFRKAMAMNRAFAVCESEYIIQIDGDIIMGRHFVEDHITEARRGYYLNGSRAKFDENTTKKLESIEKVSPHFYSKGLKRRANAMRLPLLTPLFYDYAHSRKDRGCNMSFWRSDLYAVNGYDNGMVGYGTEDIDLPERLRRFGVKKRFVKFKAIEFHLFHKEAEDKAVFNTDNHKRYVYYNEHNIVRVEDGIERFLKQI